MTDRSSYGIAVIVTAESSAAATTAIATATTAIAIVEKSLYYRWAPNRVRCCELRIRSGGRRVQMPDV